MTQEFDFTLHHTPGKSNIADVPSRAHEKSGDNAVDSITLDDMPSSLRPQPEIIQSPIVDTSTIAPDHLEAIAKVHHASLSGHRGITATIRDLRRLNVSWPTLRADVVKYIHACPTCQKSSRNLPHANFVPATVDTYEPFYCVATDWIGPLPADNAGNTYIHTVVCHATRYTYLFPATTPSAENTARDLVSVFAHHDAAHIILSDNGPAYIAEITKLYFDMLHSTHVRGIPYHHQQNAIVERTNGSVLRHLRALVNTIISVDNWSSALPIVQRLLNTTHHTVLQCTPSALLFGRNFTADRTLFKPIPDPPAKKALNKRYQEMIKLQSDLLIQSQRHQAEHTDAYLLHHSGPQISDVFPNGSLVLVTYPERPPTKFHTHLRGPFRVLDHDEERYHCLNLVNGRALSFHISQLRPYTTDLNPKSLTPLQVAMKDNDEDIVDHIVDHRIIPGGSVKKRTTLEFRVRWFGYDENADTWEPYVNVRELAALDVYCQTVPELAYLL